jgi:hypothetical protein
MAAAEEMSQPGEQQETQFVRGVLVKTALVFVIVNLGFALLAPLSWLGGLSAYNFFFPGRLRLPFGEVPQRAYNLSLLQLESMFASHELAGTPKTEAEFRVFLLGDSNTWGYLLGNDQTLAANLNQMRLVAPDGRGLRFYNLGYPTISLTKDLLILDQVKQFDPDLVIWLVTLEAFPQEKQLFTPLVQHNPEPVRRLIETYDLASSPSDPAFSDQTFLQQTIVGDRRTLADMIRHQVYGVLWAATGIDQDIPESYPPLAQDLSAEVEYYGMRPPAIDPEDLALDVLHAGHSLAEPIPVILVNEPMYISQGENSDIRYNFYYPRWAFDEYRRILAEESMANGWHYLDLWDQIAPDRFTNTAIHLDAEGTAELASIIGPYILQVLELE